MANIYAANEYRRSLAQSDDSAELTIVLYDLLIERLRRAVRVMPDPEARSRSIQDALSVLDALQANLDMAAGGDAARNLDTFYTVLRQGILMAHAEASATGVEQQIRPVLSLRSAWKESLRAASSRKPSAVP